MWLSGIHKKDYVMSIEETCIYRTRVGWKTHLQADYEQQQWSNSTIFFYIVSSAVHTLLPSVLQRLDSRGIETLILDSPQLQIWPHSRSDTSQLNVVVFHLGEQKIDGAKSGEYGGWSTSLKPHVQSRTSVIVTTYFVQAHCPGETGLAFISFPDRLDLIAFRSYLS